MNHHSSEITRNNYKKLAKYFEFYDFAAPKDVLSLRENRTSPSYSALPRDGARQTNSYISHQTDDDEDNGADEDDDSESSDHLSDALSCSSQWKETDFRKDSTTQLSKGVTSPICDQTTCNNQDLSSEFKDVCKRQDDRPLSNNVKLFLKLKELYSKMSDHCNRHGNENISRCTSLPALKEFPIPFFFSTLMQEFQNQDCLMGSFLQCFKDTLLNQLSPYLTTTKCYDDEDSNKKASPSTSALLRSHLQPGSCFESSPCAPGILSWSDEDVPENVSDKEDSNTFDFSTRLSPRGKRKQKKSSYSTEKNDLFSRLSTKISSSSPLKRTTSDKMIKVFKAQDISNSSQISNKTSPGRANTSHKSGYKEESIKRETDDEQMVHRTKNDCRKLLQTKLKSRRCRQKVKDAEREVMSACDPTKIENCRSDRGSNVDKKKIFQHSGKKVEDKSNQDPALQFAYALMTFFEKSGSLKPNCELPQASSSSEMLVKDCYNVTTDKNLAIKNESISAQKQTADSLDNAAGVSTHPPSGGSYNPSEISKKIPKKRLKSQKYSHRYSKPSVKSECQTTDGEHKRERRSTSEVWPSASAKSKQSPLLNFRETNLQNDKRNCGKFYGQSYDFGKVECPPMKKCISLFKENGKMVYQSSAKISNHSSVLLDSYLEGKNSLLKNNIDEIFFQPIQNIPSCFDNEMFNCSRFLQSQTPEFPCELKFSSNNRRTKEYISNSKRSSLEKVISVWSLEDVENHPIAKDLSSFLLQLSDESQFGSENDRSFSFQSKLNATVKSIKVETRDNKTAMKLRRKTYHVREEFTNGHPSRSVSLPSNSIITESSHASIAPTLSRQKIFQFLDLDTRYTLSRWMDRRCDPPNFKQRTLDESSFPQKLETAKKKVFSGIHLCDSTDTFSFSSETMWSESAVFYQKPKKPTEKFEVDDLTWTSLSKGFDQGKSSECQKDLSSFEKLEENKGDSQCDESTKCPTSNSVDSPAKIAVSTSSQTVEIVVEKSCASTSVSDLTQVDHEDKHSVSTQVNEPVAKYLDTCHNLVKVPLSSCPLTLNAKLYESAQGKMENFSQSKLFFHSENRCDTTNSQNGDKECHRKMSHKVESTLKSDSGSGIFPDIDFNLRNSKAATFCTDKQSLKENHRRHVARACYKYQTNEEEEEEEDGAKKRQAQMKQKYFEKRNKNTSFRKSENVNQNCCKTNDIKFSESGETKCATENKETDPKQETTCTRTLLDAVGAESSEQKQVNHTFSANESFSIAIAKCQFIEALKATVEKGFSVDWEDPWSGERPLVCAVVKSQYEIISRLLDLGSILDAPDINGRTAFLAASILVDNQAAWLLLSHGLQITGLVPLKIAHGRSKCFSQFVNFLNLAVSSGFNMSRDIKWFETILKDNATVEPQNNATNRDHQLLARHLLSSCRQPHSLATSCFIVIRQHLYDTKKGRSILSSIDRLPLPKSLKQFLSMEKAM